VHAHFEARGHHAGGILHAGLIVENKLLRQQMQDFAIPRQRHGASLVHRLANFLASNLPRPRAKSNTPVAVHPTNVRARNPNQRVFNRNAGHVFRMLHRFLNAVDRLVEFGNHTLPQASRFADPVPPITQSVVAPLGHQDCRLGAADINCGDEIGLVARHK